MQTSENRCKKMNKARYLKLALPTQFLLLLSILLTACHPALLPSTSTPGPSVANFPLSFPATKTATEPAPTLTSTSIPRSTSTAVLETPDALQNALFADCQTSSPDLPQHTLSAHLILSDQRQYFLFDLASRKITNLDKSTSEDMADDYSASRDGKWVVYTVWQRKTSTIFGMIEPAENIIQQRARQWTRWGMNNFSGIFGWLDDQHLIITRQSKTFFDSTVVLNPWTGTEEEFSLSDAPEPASSIGAQLYFFNDQVNILPDPSLRMLVYPRQEHDGASYVTLWDRQSKQVVAKLRDLLPYYGVPLWSPDGADFVTSVSTGHSSDYKDWVFDLFQVTREGQIRQLTHFGKFLTRNHIWRVSRSPDGHYLAFQVDYRSGQQTVGSLLVMDLNTAAIKPLCFDTVPAGNNVLDDTPVWSPDSRYVVLSPLDQNFHRQVILVDLNANQSFRVADDMVPRGWLVDQ